MCLHIDHWANAPHGKIFRPDNTTPKEVMKRRKPKRAKKDITVYKFLKWYSGLGAAWFSPYQLHPYPIGKVMKHKQADINTAREDAMRDGQVWGGAFHSYARCPPDTFRAGDEEVFEAIIPKGSLYWESNDRAYKEYASTRIKIIRPLRSGVKVSNPERFPVLGKLQA